MSAVPDFITYFTALWGHPPFPWQSELALRLERKPAAEKNQTWPDWITLPTGTGKTATLDIAIYDLARQAARRAAERTAPVRIVFAVNRRIVVDEAYTRARRIVSGLSLACGYRKIGDFPEHQRVELEKLDLATLLPFAEALRSLAGTADGPPLEAFPLRGGTFTDHSWARTPTQPLILTTTLDQLGSRLLFRGYGVSPGARPIQAALLANDSLLILDEAHTAMAFSQTLGSVSKLRRQAADRVRLPFASVQLTATPPAGATDAYRLTTADRENKIVRQRLEAAKPVTLVKVADATGSERHKRLAEAIGNRASELVADHRRVLIVVNRVATAEALLGRLTSKSALETHQSEVKLLTGRIRPLDRDTLIGTLGDFHQLKKTKPDSEVPRLILIATQTIEVGADFDFDVLLTELAPLDSLRQRFGRLNRQGRPIPAPASIFAPSEALDEKKPDPIYSTCLPAVWKWLSDRTEEAPLDFGIDAFDRIAPDATTLPTLLAPAPEAPLLIAPHLDLLCQTSPAPHVCPDPALYIHGPGKDFPQVSVLFRADLDHPDALDILRTAPPVGAEAASLPLTAVRLWLEKPTRNHETGGDAPEISDSTPATPKELAVPRVFVWRDREPFPLNKSASLRPGDIVILDANLPRTQLDKLLTLPAEAASWQLDQYEAAHLLARDKLAIRLHSGVITEIDRLLPSASVREQFHELLPPLPSPFPDAEEDFSEKKWCDAFPELATFLAKHLKLPDDHPWKDLWNHASGFHGRWRINPYPEKSLAGIIATHPDRVGASNWPLEPADLGRQDNSAEGEITLDQHSLGVASRAESNASGLNAPLAATLRDSALWHDLGKADPRFQAMLHGCSLWSVASLTQLAKSTGFRPLPLGRFFRRQAGLPDGFRHELLSTLIVAASQAGASHTERDLLLHLIASHHGHCRPAAPVVPDDDPQPFDATVANEAVRYSGVPAPLANFTDGVPDRFWNLTRRFGWWGLPYLEALLRLADQYESANPSTSKS